LVRCSIRSVLVQAREMNLEVALDSVEKLHKNKERGKINLITCPAELVAVNVVMVFLKSVKRLPNMQMQSGKISI